MKVWSAKQIFILIMVLFLGAFDQHIAGYFSGAIEAGVSAEAFPAHHDVPAKTFDHHEDLLAKHPNISIPVPVIFPSDYSLFCQRDIPPLSPKGVWQPPETIS